MSSRFSIWRQLVLTFKWFGFQVRRRFKSIKRFIEKNPKLVTQNSTNSYNVFHLVSGFYVYRGKIEVLLKPCFKIADIILSQEKWESLFTFLPPLAHGYRFLIIQPRMNYWTPEEHCIASVAQLVEHGAVMREAARSNLGRINSQDLKITEEKLLPL